MSEKQSKRKRHNRHELDADVRIHRIHVLGDIVGKLGAALIRGATIVGSIYFGFAVPIGHLAGHMTHADISVSGLGDFLSEIFSASSTPTIIWVAVAAFSSIGWLRERKLRQDVIERYHPEHKKRELGVDPSRSSSNLTKRGLTRKEDL